MSRNYNDQSAADLLDSFSSSIGFGDSSFLTTIWNDLTGNTAQQKQFEQQEYLMDKENAYNTPAEQVKRLREAGINVNSAASQIAQNNVSACPQQVADNTQGVANAVKSLADLGMSAATGISTPSSIEKNLADALHASELGISEQTFREDRLNQIMASWHCDDVTARMNEVLLNHISEEQLARINNMNAQSELFSQQLLLYQQQINNMQKEIEKIDSDISVNDSIITLNDSQVKVNAKVAAQFELENLKLRWRNEIITRVGGDPTQPLEQQLFEIANKFGVGSIPFQSALISATDAYNSNYNAQFELYKKEQQIAYDNAINQLEAYMKKELGNKYLGLPADLINSIGKGFGIGFGMPLGAKTAAAVNPSAPIGYTR